MVQRKGTVWKKYKRKSISKIGISEAVLILFTNCNTIPCHCLGIKIATFSLLSSPSVGHTRLNYRGMMFWDWGFSFAPLYSCETTENEYGLLSMPDLANLEKGSQAQKSPQHSCCTAVWEGWLTAVSLQRHWALWHRKNLRAESSPTAEITYSVLGREDGSFSVL